MYSVTQAPEQIIYDNTPEPGPYIPTKSLSPSPSPSPSPKKTSTTYIIYIILFIVVAIILYIAFNSQLNIPAMPFHGGIIIRPS